MTSYSNSPNRSPVTTWTFRAMSVFVFGTLSLWMLTSGPVHAQGLGVKDETNAKIARIKIMQKLEQNESAREANIRSKNNQQDGSDNSDPASNSNSNQSGCGSLNIGNTTENQPGAPKQNVQVIIIGDVINGVGDC